MIKKFLDLGMQPLANKYLTKKDLIKKKENFYHLELGFNTSKKLVSILNTVPSNKMFDNKIFDFANAFFGKKIEIKSSKVECIFLNTMLMHSVVNSLIDKKPTIRLFYNF